MNDGALTVAIEFGCAVVGVEPGRAELGVFG